MNRRTDETRSRNPASDAQTGRADQPKRGIPLDLDDILGIAIFDSVLRVKRRKLRSGSASRRPK